jgi:hypothetical protein
MLMELVPQMTGNNSLHGELKVQQIFYAGSIGRS